VIAHVEASLLHVQHFAVLPPLLLLLLLLLLFLFCSWSLHWLCD
jgi:hypothetical protein